jgi:hypothetical protein
MRNRRFGMLFLLLVLAACAQAVSAQRTDTLYAPKLIESKEPYKELDDSRSYLGFQTGVRGRIEWSKKGALWDIAYGFLSINDEDWLNVSHGNVDRSVIKDLGELNWADYFEVPVLTPLPELAKGQERVITVDASAGTAKEWARTNGIFAKALVGHMYAVRIKRENVDFYALFRIESLKQRESCTVSWMMIAPPEDSKF